MAGMYTLTIDVELFFFIWYYYCGNSAQVIMYLLPFCRTYDPSRRRIRAGTTYRNTGGQVVNVAQEFNHPSYREDPDRGLDGDITVVQLAEPLVYNPVVQQATIVAPNTEIPDGIPVIHAGWGATQVPTLFIHSK